MSLSKIKLRNLDEELVAYLRGLESVSTSGYNDSEIKLRITAVESQKADKTELEKYQLKKDSVTEDFVSQSVKTASDALFENIGENFENLVSSIENAKTELTDMVSGGYIQNKNNVITEAHLAKEIQSKLNGSASGGTVDLTEVYDKLAMIESELVQADEKYIRAEENSVQEKHLEPGIIEKLNSARSTDDLIKTEDLSPTVLELINNGGMGISEEQEDVLERAVNFFDGISGGEAGSVLMVTDDDEDSYRISPEYILMQNCIIIEESLMLDELKSSLTMSLSEDSEAPSYYILDLETDKVYIYYPDAEGYVAEEYENKLPAEIMAGRFAVAYKTENIYFGVDKTSYRLVLDKSSINNKIRELEDSMASFKEFQEKYESWLAENAKDTGKA